MIQIELAPLEAELLQEILYNYHSELEMEVARTSRKEYREFLEKRDRFLEDFLRRLEGEMAVSGTDYSHLAVRAGGTRHGRGTAFPEEIPH